jgi:hypothetical protein
MPRNGAFALLTRTGRLTPFAGKGGSLPLAGTDHSLRSTGFITVSVQCNPRATRKTFRRAERSRRSRQAKRCRPFTSREAARPLPRSGHSRVRPLPPQAALSNGALTPFARSGAFAALTGTAGSLRSPGVAARSRAPDGSLASAGEGSAVPARWLVRQELTWRSPRKILPG